MQWIHDNERPNSNAGEHRNIEIVLYLRRRGKRNEIKTNFLNLFIFSDSDGAGSINFYYVYARMPHIFAQFLLVRTSSLLAQFGSLIGARTMYWHRSGKSMANRRNEMKINNKHIINIFPIHSPFTCSLSYSRAFFLRPSRRRCR